MNQQSPPPQDNVEATTTNNTASSTSNNCLPQTITIVVDGVYDFVDYLNYHIINYQKLYPHIDIKLRRVENGGSGATTTTTTLEEELIQSSSSSSTSWDGSIFPTQLTGALVDNNILWDWTEYIEEGSAQQQQQQQASSTTTTASTTGIHQQSQTTNSHNLQWPDVLPFFRNEQSLYDNKVKSIPIDGDLLLLYYRKDLFEQHGIQQVPRTWEEYTTIAKYFHNQPLGPNNTNIYGSCISRIENCGTTPYWTNLILSSMTQTLGTSTGFILDPTSRQTITTTTTTSSSRSSSSGGVEQESSSDGSEDSDGSDWNFNFWKQEEEDIWDPILLGSAMKETLWHTSEQVRYGHPNELSGSNCLEVNYNFNLGQCAMTINWGNQLSGLLLSNDDDTTSTSPSSSSSSFVLNDMNVGIAPTPGSRRVLDRTTKELINCTATTCPNGILYSDLGLVNVAPYAAFGGWAAGISNTISPNQQRAMAHFFSYLSNAVQSVQDVVPNDRSTFAQPYRYSHLLQSSRWLGGGDGGDELSDENGNTTTTTTSPRTLSPSTARLISDFTRATRHGFVDSKNTVLEVRIPEGQVMRDIIDEEVHLYLKAFETFGRNLTDEIRSEVTKDMEQRIREELKLDEQDQILRDRAQEELNTGRIPQTFDTMMTAGTNNNNMVPMNYTLLERYQQSLNVFPEPADHNFIEPSLRMAGWGLGGMICGGALMVLLWTLWYRRHRVIIAAQSNILIQSSVGIFFLGLTIPLLSLDESLGLNQDMLDYTCMVIPWCYTLGFTILFSAIYAKIRQCKKVYSDPRRYHNLLLVPRRAAIKLCLRLLLVNGALLFIWHTVDRLRWHREEMPGSSTFSSGGGEDGTGGRSRIVLPDTYGTCKGSGNAYIGFATLVFVVNQTMLIFAILQAFKCRFLTVEFNEMQWMPLALVPMVEAWMVGAPILFLVQSYPTGIFVVLTMVIGFSSFSAMLAIFAPKEWYIRRDFYDTEKRIVRHGPHPSGVVVLSHPDVADAREIERLQLMLDNYDASNIEIEQEIFAIKVKLNDAATPEAKVAAPMNLLGVPGSPPRVLPGTHVTDIARSMSTIKEKCDEILSMADDDFSDSEWSDEPDEKIENEDGAELMMEGMNKPEFTDRSNSERGPDSWKEGSESGPSPDSWRAPSVSGHDGDNSISEHGPDSWRAPWATDDDGSNSSHRSGPSPDSWRAPSVSDHSEHGPDSWKAPKVDTNDPYGYGTDSAGVPVDSLVATPNSSLAVYEDSNNSREVSRSSEHDLESGASMPSNRLQSTPDRHSRLPSSSPSRSTSVFEDSPGQEAAPSAYSPPRRGYTDPHSKASPGSFSMFAGDGPSIVGAASAASVGMSTTLSLSMDEDSNSGSTALGPSPPTSIGDSTAARSADMKIMKQAPSPSQTLDTKRSSTSTMGTKEVVRPGADAKSGEGDDLSYTSSGSDDSGRLIRKKEYSVLGSALKSDDLQAIEANASRLAESLKSRLNDTTLSDYGDEPIVKEDLSVKICASFDTDAGESMADMILNTLLEPSSALVNLTGVSGDGGMIEEARALDASMGGSSSGSGGGGSNGKPELSAGESSSAENNIFRDTTVSTNSSGLMREWDTNVNGQHTQKAGEPSRGDFLRHAEEGGLGTEKLGASSSPTRPRGKIEEVLRSSLDNNSQQKDIETFEPRKVSDSKGYSGLLRGSPKRSPGTTNQGNDLKDGRFPMHGIFNMGTGMEGGIHPNTPGSHRSWTPPEDLDLHMKREGTQRSTPQPQQQQQQQSPLNIPWSPPDDLASSFELGDWAAVGMTASVLNDDTDSQSTSSRATDSVSESVSSIDATQSASALDTPLANQLDKLVGRLDWDGIKNAAVKYETKPNGRTQHHVSPPSASLEEKRRRKREIEAWRSSIAQSISRSPN